MKQLDQGIDLDTLALLTLGRDVSLRALDSDAEGKNVADC